MLDSDRSRGRECEARGKFEDNIQKGSSKSNGLGANRSSRCLVDELVYGEQCQFFGVAKTK